MTYEGKLAEEYLDKKYLKDMGVRNPCKEAFLAGYAKANEWHDLREDPNDLPDLETELLCQKPSGRCFVGYYKDNKFYSHETGMAYEVVRWLDIGV